MSAVDEALHALQGCSGDTRGGDEKTVVAMSAGSRAVLDRFEAALSASPFDVRTTAVGAGVLRDVLAQSGSSPDVIVVGEPLGSRSHATVEALRADHPDAGLVAVGGSSTMRAARRALAAGADGYVLEDEVETALAAAVAAVRARLACVPLAAKGAMSKPVFSYREKQVLHLAAHGLTNSQIAQRLHLAESTVKSHLSSSFRKLGVTSRAEAALLVLDPDSGLGLDGLLGGGDGNGAVAMAPSPTRRAATA